MEVKVVQGNIKNFPTEALIVGSFENAALVGGMAEVDVVLNGAVGEIIANGDFAGKTGELSVLYPRGLMPAKRVVLVGLGKEEKCDGEALRRAAASAMKRARDLKAQHVASVLPVAPGAGFSTSASAQAWVEGALLALYKYDAPKQETEPKIDVQSLTMVESEPARAAEIEVGARFAEAITAGVVRARNLVNMPPNVATPTRLAQEAEQVAVAFGLKFFAGDRAWATQQDMGSFLGVAKGAQEPPKFIILEHNGDQTDLDTVVLVGKGITFDSGGISLKPGEGMSAMKSDMSGAAAVLGALQVVAQLKLPLRVIGLAPCTENMPDGGAYRPADVVKASNGKTIEIISTDAEGRLILADALVYAQKYQPKAVVDLATLTGACVVALGNGVAAGIFCNDEKLQDRLVTSGKTTHERLWPLPLYEDYKKAIKSDVADMKNSGGRSGGVGTSAVFLQEFVDYPWAHLDIAGMALTEKDDAYIPAGGVGFGVRLLIDFLRNW